MSALQAAPDAAVPAYPNWANRDLALHVVRVCANASIALRSGALERPSPQVGVSRDGDPTVLADAVRRALREAEVALERCQHHAVWTPVGARSPSFWGRRLLREAVLHRWDAEQASGAAADPDERQATELVDEFLNTDAPRAMTEADEQRSGDVTIQAGSRRWTVDLASGAVVDAGAWSASATISGEPAAVWLWLMRRDGLPGPVSIDDAQGQASAFVERIDQLRRPKR